MDALKIKLTISINKIKSFYHYFRSLAYKPFFKKMGTGTIIFFPTCLLTPCYISIGKNIRLGKYARIQGIDKYGSSRFEPEIILEDNVSIQQNIHLTCAQKISIGKNTAIASNVTISDINHQYEDPDTPVEYQPIETKPIEIGKDCKIYNNAIILPGTKIGNHCVVGANSVVSGSFENYTVIVGSPARVVKRYHDNLKWWIGV